MEKFIYYPGCIGESCSKQLDRVTKLVMKKLELDFEYAQDMSCCGSVNLKEKDEFYNLVINGRNFAIAERMGMDIITICNTCLYIMTKANKRLIENPFLRQKVNNILRDFNLHYSGGIKIKHLLWYLLEDYGIEKLKKDVKIDLRDLKVAPFYGCHIIRPRNVLSFDHSFEKNDLDLFIKIMGASLVKKEVGENCCGFHVQKINEKQVVSMVEDINEGMAKVDVIVTPCTECDFALDVFAYKSKKLKKKKPVLFFTQLLGLGLGMGEKELEFGKNFIALKEIFKIVQGKKGPVTLEEKKTVGEKIQEEKTKKEKKPAAPIEELEPAPLPEKPAEISNEIKVDKKFDMGKARKEIMK